MLYCGGELDTVDAMPLTPVTRAVSNVLLSLLSRIVGSDMDYSFGGSSEKPHISFPLVEAMDRIIVTKASSTEPPPMMGVPFPEPQSERRPNVVWNTQDTYSMSFHSSCVDLATWKVVHPFTVDLKQFWGNDAGLRLVIYDKQCNASNSDDEDDPKKKYLLALQVQHQKEGR